MVTWVLPHRRLRLFPAEVRREVEHRLLRGEYQSLRSLSAELAERGFRLGKSALFKHRQRLLRMDAAESRRSSPKRAR